MFYHIGDTMLTRPEQASWFLRADAFNLSRRCTLLQLFDVKTASATLGILHPITFVIGPENEIAPSNYINC